jgi:hypothetical protein
MQRATEKVSDEGEHVWQNFGRRMCSSLHCRAKIHINDTIVEVLEWCCNPPTRHVAKRRKGSHCVYWSALSSAPAHRRVGQPPGQAAKVPLAAYVGARAQQHIQPQVSGRLQEARDVGVSGPVEPARAGFMQVPGHICLSDHINMAYTSELHEF